MTEVAWAQKEPLPPPGMEGTDDDEELVVSDPVEFAAPDDAAVDGEDVDELPQPARPTKPVAASTAVASQGRRFTA